MTLFFSACFLQKAGCPNFQKAGCPIFKNSGCRLTGRVCLLAVLYVKTIESRETYFQTKMQPHRKNFQIISSLLTESTLTTDVKILKSQQTFFRLFRSLSRRTKMSWSAGTLKGLELSSSGL